MKTYEVAIVDDDPRQRDLLKKMVEAHQGDAAFAVSTYEGIDALESAIDEGARPSIMFMDIVFGEEASADAAAQGRKGPKADLPANGIDEAARLTARFNDLQVIYVTGHIELCTRVYRTRHVSFLPKPVSRTDLDEALGWAVDNLLSLPNRPFAVKVFGRLVSIDPRTVAYVESDKRKVRIVMDDEVVEAYESMTNMMDKLPASFVQSHKSYIINLDKVAEMRADTAVMSSGASVPVSQKRSREVRKAFSDHLVQRL